VDLSDTGAYLRLSSDMYELTAAGGLGLTAHAGGQTLFEVSLDGLTPQQTHLHDRVGPGVRKLPFDLAAALAPHGGVARDVELAITAASADAPAFWRWIGVVDLLTAGAAARPGLLAEIETDGVMEALSDGWLSGWYRAPERGDSLSLHIDGQLVAKHPVMRAKPELRGNESVADFRFHVADLVRLGYASGGDISVRVSGANVPLRGVPLIVSEARVDRRYDHGRQTWVRVPRLRRTVAEQVRKRWRGP
jgi:hypothetical protein